MRVGIVLLMALSLSACSIFGGKKTRLVPQAYMPDPPGILMQAPKDLKTIKKTNLDVSETSVTVNAPEEKSE